MMFSTGSLKWWAAMFALSVPAMAADPIAEGRILVADRYLEDPNFAETVILIVRYNKDGAMGLMLNRRTDVPISRVLKPLKEAAGHDDPVFLGGPVEETGAFGLLRTTDRPDGAKKVSSDVYFLSNKDLIQKTLAGNSTSNAFRVYLGYSGWGPGQLESELGVGAWKSITGNAEKIFDGDPDTLWTRLIHETEGQVVEWKPRLLNREPLRNSRKTECCPMSSSPLLDVLAAPFALLADVRGRHTELPSRARP